MFFNGIYFQTTYSPLNHIFIKGHIILSNIYFETTYRSSNNMLVIKHICLKDIYMSYKFHVTYICCMILNNIQIHFKPSRTYTYIQQSIVLGHLLLRIHYLMALPGLDPVEGSQRFTSFLVRLLVFKSRAVTYTPVGCVSLLRNVCMCQCACMCQCVCMCLQSG